MSYQVIARKWRPQNFDQLVGQNHISTTLQNALKNGRVPHAILFTGTRGTGKTSSARILAKALRCEHPVNFVPCDQCRNCLAMVSGSDVDVQEIDGASNNGVDAIRELRDSVGYMPSSGKYKIYIIDEVHMLSTAAFNALLKTLEEPPEHVVFIMATTDVHKIPQTILSRCQRFDFRRITTRQITDHLKMICAQEKIVADENSLWAIARQGDGSMRDSLSLLDQVITFSDGPLTHQSVVEILGLTDHTLLYETLAALVRRDSSAILTVLGKIARAGYEPSLYAQNLMENLRHLLLIKICDEQALQMVELADSEVRAFQELARQLGEEEIHFLFDMAVKGATDIARSSEPRIVLEMVLLRMTAAPKIRDLQSLLNGTALPVEAAAAGAAGAASGAGASGGAAGLVSTSAAALRTSAAEGATSFAATRTSPAAATSGAAAANRTSGPNSGAKAANPGVNAASSSATTSGASSNSAAASPAGLAAAATARAGTTSMPSPANASSGPAAVAKNSAVAAKISPIAAMNENLDLPPQERWFELIQKLRGLDALLAAKVEPLIFTGLTDKTIHLSIPAKVAFLRDQLSDPDVLKKIKGLIEQVWGPGYAIDIAMSQGAAAVMGTSAMTLAQDKQKKKQADMALAIAEHPKVKTAAAAFKGQIKSIKETGSQNGGDAK